MELEQNRPERNVRRRRLSLQDRARVCQALHRFLEIEATRAATAQRNVRLRMAIGLPPVPRRLDWQRWQ
jgi:hypothetical protein